MRLVSLSAALCVVFLAADAAWGQAGRYIPVPRAPVAPGGGGVHVVPHVPSTHGGGGGGDLGGGFWVVVAIIGLAILAALGWKLGQTLGGRRRPSAVPPPQDLILDFDRVGEKDRKTTRLLGTLARTDAAFDPSALRAFVAATFTRVQHCWEKQDYDPVRDLLAPALLAQHEALLRAMRRNHEVNRIEDLRLRRLEFVHVHRTREPDLAEVTALITFEAKIYFVRERTGEFLRGSRAALPYQEFWTFRRTADGWCVEFIERSHESNRLNLANRVEGMDDVDRRLAEDGVIAL